MSNKPFCRVKDWHKVYTFKKVRGLAETNQASAMGYADFIQRRKPQTLTAEAVKGLGLRCNGLIC